MSTRSVHIRAAAGGHLKTATYEGREHLVVPVVALMEGVMFASNAPAPEFVPAATLAKSASGWNGEPVMLNHPAREGLKTTANHPETLERESFGRVFAARFEKNRLLMEAWLDVAKAKRVPGAEAVIERIRAGQTIEVSVGAFVEVENTAGRWAGHEYRGIWRDVVPDHLAMLPEGVTGACSVSMGCGAMRAASRGEKPMCEQDCKCSNDVPAPRNLWSEMREASQRTGAAPKQTPLEAYMGRRTPISEAE
jgi:hypothetical protein